MQMRILNPKGPYKAFLRQTLSGLHAKSLVSGKFPTTMPFLLTFQIQWIQLDNRFYLSRWSDSHYSGHRQICHLPHMLNPKFSHIGSETTGPK